MRCTFKTPTGNAFQPSTPGPSLTDATSSMALEGVELWNKDGLYSRPARIKNELYMGHGATSSVNDDQESLERNAL